MNAQPASEAQQAIANSIWQGLFSAEVGEFARSWLSLTLDQVGECRAAAVFAALTPGGQWQLVAGSLPATDHEAYTAILLLDHLFQYYGYETLKKMFE